MESEQSRVARRRSWFGFKRHAKGSLAMRVPHALLRLALRLLPDFPKKGRLPAPARLREIQGYAGHGSFIMVKPDRCEVAKELYWGGGRRWRPADRLAVDLFASLAETSDVMLDIGAYTGIFTLAGTAANPSLRAHAFEIVPEVFDVLRENCKRNHITERTTLYLAGVGKPGDVMRIPTKTGGSALPSFYSRAAHFDEGAEISFVSLDSLLDVVASDSRVAVKIDVEGTEDDVLLFGQEFLASLKPDILCEVLEGVANAMALQELLSPHGYTYYLVRDSGIQAQTDLRGDSSFRDWLFTTRSAADLAAASIRLA